ncbi:MAG TPA: flavin reductase family protein [Candidatus Angelobacter sp.]|nr:flavin reductase family protein [Candidatus Angelobacter sp.]
MPPLGLTLRKLLLGNEKRPGWAVVSVNNPEDHVQVTLEGIGAALDITSNHVIVELLPLLVAIGFQIDDLPKIQSAKLWMTFREAGKIIGRVKIAFEHAVALPGCQLCIFRTVGGRDYSLPPVRMQVNQLYHRCRLFFDRNPRNKKMKMNELFYVWVLYMRLRPVYLMSYCCEEGSNLYPMDLIGFIGQYYLLSIRKSDPGLSLVAKAGRMALSSVPVSYRKLLNRLGSNHGKAIFDWSSIPVVQKSSSFYGIPIPHDAHHVMELKLVEQFALDDHMVLVTSLAHQESFTSGTQICFTSRFFQQYLLRQGRPLEVHEEEK